MSKKLSGILLLLLSVLMIFIVTDIHLWRGYYLINLLYPFPMDKFEGDIEFTITENLNGNWDLSIENKDFAYYPLMVYRETRNFNLTDSVLFLYAIHRKYSISDTTIYDTGGGFDCGTGLGLVLIRPFEKFELKNISNKELIQYISHDFERIPKSLLKPNLIKEINVQRFLSIGSFGKEETRIYSNKIKLPNEWMLEVYSSMSD